MEYLFWLLLWLLHQPSVVKNFCLFRLSLTGIWLRETSYILLRSLGNSEQLPQLISRSFLLFRGVFLTCAVLLPLLQPGLLFTGSGVAEDALVQLGSALLVWELSSTKHRLKDKPSQTTNQCWLFFLSEVVPCLGGGRGMASLVSAPIWRDERRLQGLLKGKGRRMHHLCQSEEEIKLS